MTLKELRKQKKLSQLQASLICNVSLRTYKRLENENKYEKTVKYRYAFELLTLFSKKKDPKIKSVISVVGLGYVGLSNAVLLAQHNKVFAIDLSNARVETIKKKIPPFNDTELSEYLSQKSLELIPTLNFEEAYKQSEIVVIATPTNYNPDTNKFDTSSVESVICDIKTVNPNAWIVIKSTVGVGFTKYVREKYQYDKILFSPEFLREGKALYDNLYPSRIVVGIPEKKKFYISKAKEFAMLLEQGAIKDNISINIVGSTEAEAIKLFANTFLALRVAYFNELDSFAQIKGLNSLDIICGVCGDPRIGDFYNNPSFGYGGYCLPKDTKELKANFDNVPEELISAIIKSNETRKDYVAYKIIEKVKHDDVVGVYRLTMKSGSDNYRQSSVLGVIERLLSNNINVVIFEPTYKETEFLGCNVVKDIDAFKKASKIIIANRYHSSLDDVREKVFTRDLLGRD